jgi:hypothetical protein
MDLKRFLAIDRQLRPLAQGAIPIILYLCVLLSLTGCHPAQRQVENEPKQIPEVLPEKKNSGKFPHCPGEIAKGSNHHKVKLTWNPSVTPNHSKEVRYCLYRSRGRVKRIKGELTVDKPPCTNCELVTEIPVPAATFIDLQVENESSYCYVAVAIEDGGRKFSEFSNQAEADIPKADEPGSNKTSHGTLCDKTTTNKNPR